MIRIGGQQQLLIEGSLRAGFEPVREAFIENFTHRVGDQVYPSSEWGKP